MNDEDVPENLTFPLIQKQITPVTGGQRLISPDSDGGSADWLRGWSHYGRRGCQTHLIKLCVNLINPPLGRLHLLSQLLLHPLLLIQRLPEEEEREREKRGRDLEGRKLLSPNKYNKQGDFSSRKLWNKLLVKLWLKCFLVILCLRDK